MKNIGILIGLISLFTVGASFPFIADIWILNASPEMTRIELANIKKVEIIISIVISFVVNIICSIWLYTRPSIKLANKYIWAFFALTTGLMAIMIFYVVHIYEGQKS